MDLKSIEMDILKINEEFIEFLDNQKENANTKTEELFSLLTDEVINEEKLIKELENKIVAEDELTKAAINAYSLKLEELVSSEKALKYNLDDAKIEFETQKAEELKPVYANLKRTRTELTHKITAQKKELSFLLKDNNDKLLALEKQYKDTELDISRKLQVALDRLNEQNIKEYSNLEKTILTIEDLAQIKQVQKEINTIRTKGLKDTLNLKLEFSKEIYQKTLEFEKAKEQLDYDKNHLNQQFIARIKDLELEYTVTNLERDLEESLGALDVELKVNEFSRENDLDQIAFQREKADNKFIIHEGLHDERIKYSSFSKEELIKINQKINQFDNKQLDEAFNNNLSILNSSSEVSLSLLSSLKSIILSFKELMITASSDFTLKRNELLNEVKNILIISKFEVLHNSSVNYNDIHKKVNEFVKVYNKILEDNHSSFISLLKTHFNSLLDVVENTRKAINLFNKEKAKENEQVINNFKLEFKEYFRVTETTLKNNFSIDERKIANTLEGENTNKKLSHSELDNQTKKVMDDYNIKKNAILVNIDNHKREHKAEVERLKKELQKEARLIKEKIAYHKKVYNRNIKTIIKEEKVSYKNMVSQAKLEYKNRLESL